ncbi:hypothetical protein NPIL_215741 [Nephila pilipes]|uniref:Uncharacterized protein n=1 Tax=Nephila pilipes TaxID=299642 RepID=A0A8X6TFW2_NEPPI|nr:hypothetical protein NPIL_215741 [Nephila pilipes]
MGGTVEKSSPGSAKAVPYTSSADEQPEKVGYQIAVPDLMLYDSEFGSNGGMADSSALVSIKNCVADSLSLIKRRLSSTPSPSVANG